MWKVGLQDSPSMHIKLTKIWIVTDEYVNMFWKTWIGESTRIMVVSSNYRFVKLDFKNKMGSGFVNLVIIYCFCAFANRKDLVGLPDQGLSYLQVWDDNKIHSFGFVSHFQIYFL